MGPRRWLPVVLCAFVTAACGRDSAPDYFDIATTTSVQQSGLLDHILPAFTAEAGVEVRVHAVGSGIALRMLDGRDVQLVISHAPEAEARALRDHADWSYRKVAHNWFVIVGPPSDPAGIRTAASARDAFQRIANSRAVFVSRGDHSGTHERELALWRETGQQLGGDRLVVSGRGMALALRHADELSAYTLSDEATFRQLERGLDLTILFRDDRSLLNTYAVVYPSNGVVASQFATWLAAGRGRTLMADYQVQGLRAYTPWPEGCPGDSPGADLCRFSVAR